MGENSNLHSEGEQVDKSESEGMWLTDPLPLARGCDQVIALRRAKYELFVLNCSEVYSKNMSWNAGASLGPWVS